MDAENELSGSFQRLADEASDEASDEAQRDAPLCTLGDLYLGTWV